MSSFTPPYKYINAKELAEIIKAQPTEALKEYAVVDVRDDDFKGGNIKSALNVPSESFGRNVEELVKKLDNVPKVVFHCALSQQRGPKAARQYAEKRNELAPDAKDKQEVLVLRDGFTGFQQLYRNDPELVEKFNKLYHD